MTYEQKQKMAEEFRAGTGLADGLPEWSRASVRATRVSHYLPGGEEGEMKTTEKWNTKMILVLLAWCVILALWNAVQSYHIQQLTEALNATHNELRGTQEALIITQGAVGLLQTNLIEQLKATQ